VQPSTALAVWFDEWNIRPGESIAAGIESGLSRSDIFLLIWSVQAARSNWVGVELRAYLHRRVADATLRIVPVMVDATPLPILVADYRGFTIVSPDDYRRIAAELSGDQQEQEVAQLLQRRLWELAKGKIPDGSPHKYIVCPQCGSPNLKHMAFFDGYKERNGPCRGDWGLHGGSPSVGDRRAQGHACGRSATACERAGDAADAASAWTNARAPGEASLGEQAS
jgi:hypothetical protein